MPCPRSTRWPRRSTAAPSASPPSWSVSAPSRPTSRTSCARPSPRSACGWRSSPTRPTTTCARRPSPRWRRPTGWSGRSTICSPWPVAGARERPSPSTSARSCGRAPPRGARTTRRRPVLSWCAPATASRPVPRPARCQQALDVLLENALRHGGGEVSVTVTTLGDHVIIGVGDQGPGVAPGREDAVFGPARTAAEGTGLGLPLARALLEATGGRLHLGRPGRPSSRWCCRGLRWLSPLPAHAPSQKFAAVSRANPERGQDAGSARYREYRADRGRRLATGMQPRLPAVF